MKSKMMKKRILPFIGICMLLSSVFYGYAQPRSDGGTGFNPHGSGGAPGDAYDVRGYCDGVETVCAVRCGTWGTRYEAAAKGSAYGVHGTCMCGGSDFNNDPNGGN